MTAAPNLKTGFNSRSIHRHVPLWLTFFIGLTGVLMIPKGVVMGDPAEYTFVAHVLGIAHPPGYAFMTLVSKLFQLLIPVGNIAQRTHLVGVVAGAIAATAVAGTVAELLNGRRAGWLGMVAGLALLFSANFWQHRLHANPHIITATFLAVNLFLLTKWHSFVAQRGLGRTPKAGGYNTPIAPEPSSAGHPFNFYLLAFALSAGLGVTHHPLTVFAFPAYTLFILVVWFGNGGTTGRLLRVGLVMFAIAMVGLLPWLYFPLRAPALVGTQFPSDMNRLDGFLNLVLARGLRVNLFAFGWRDQVDRFMVFFSLLRLQYTWPVIAVAVVGVLRVVRRQRASAVLLVGAFLFNYAFVINTVQDVMAYLLGPFVLIAILAGVGMASLLDAVPAKRVSWLVAGLVLVGVLWPFGRNFLHIYDSLTLYDEGEAYIDAVHAQFDGSGEGAVLLNDWEHMTVLWYADRVEGRTLDEADIRPIFVSAATPWVDGVFQNLPSGPVYLSRFERSIFDAGFRIRPRQAVWQVVEPGDTTLPSELTSRPPNGEPVSIVGHALQANGGDHPVVYAQDKLRLTLALQASAETDDVYAPELWLADDLYLPFTTDSHLLTSQYQPGEIIVEAYDFAVPDTWNFEGGSATVQLRNLTTDSLVGQPVVVRNLLYGDNLFPPRYGRFLANFRQQVGLSRSVVRSGLQMRSNSWEKPLVVQPSDTIHITLNWEALNVPTDSYTVFVHLIDYGNRPIIDDLDYTPLGGAAPTHLWFPKWLPGQTYTDPYQMRLDGVPPGDYLIEVGLYEQFTKRRLPIADENGNHVGDRFILGGVTVQP